jgi:hypothetical protein
MAIETEVSGLKSKITTLNAYEQMMEAMEESSLPAPPAEPQQAAEDWKPKVGELAVYDGICGKVDAHSINVGDWWSIFGRWVPTRKLSEPSEAEIAEHRPMEEWAKIAELQQNDWTPTTDGLIALITKHKAWLSGDSKKYAGLTVDTSSGTIQGWEYMGGKPHSANELSEDEFKRRLQGTIAKKEEERLKAEESKPLAFGMPVKVRNSGADWLYLRKSTSASDDDRHLLAHEDGVTMMKRSEFTVIDKP